MKIYQDKVSEKHNDSFWYDGLIAETDNAKLYAVGDIRIIDRKTDSIYDNKARDSFRFRPENDDELAQMNEDKDIEWDMNNWFEIVWKDDMESYGDIEDTYDEGIKALQEAINDK